MARAHRQRWILSMSEHGKQLLGGALWRAGLLSLGQLGLASLSLAACVSGFCSLGLPRPSQAFSFYYPQSSFFYPQSLSGFCVE